MDILAVIAAITNLVTEVIKSQPPDVAAELWRLHLKDVQEFRKFFENVLPKSGQRVSEHYADAMPDVPIPMPFDIERSFPKPKRKAKKR